MKILLLCVFIIQYVPPSSSSLSSSECNYCMYKSCMPTVFPAASFDAKDDKERLLAAVNSKGSQESLIASILTSRSDTQRLKILEEYVTTGTMLTDDIKRGVHTESYDILEALTKPLPLFLVEEIHDALRSDDHEALSEIFVSLPNCAIREISVYYRTVYKISIIQDIGVHEWMNYKTFLQELAKGNRDESIEVDTESAKKNAQALMDSLSSMVPWKKHSKFTEVFTKYSFPQLREIFDNYDFLRKNKDPSYKSIITDIRNSFGGKFGDGLVTVVRNARDQWDFFAKELHIGFTGYPIPIEKRRAVRIIRTRCEVDLQDIKNMYLNKYHVSLMKGIENMSSYDIRKSYVAVLNELN